MQTIEDPGCGIFVYAGVMPNTQLYTELDLQDGYIVTNDKMETSFRAYTQPETSAQSRCVR